MRRNIDNHGMRGDINSKKVLIHNFKYVFLNWL